MSGRQRVPSTAPWTAGRRTTLGASESLYGKRSLARCTSGSLNLRPMNRFTEKMVFSGFVMACRFAT